MGEGERKEKKGLRFEVWGLGFEVLGFRVRGFLV
jgi:hypothetical protein